MKIKRKLLLDKKAVFGLSAVQQFFVIILAIAMLAYVIVIIMGTLSSSNILTTPAAVSVINETAIPTSSGVYLTADTTHSGCTATVTRVTNSTGVVVNSGNYSVTGCKVANLTDSYIMNPLDGWNFTYSYTYRSQAQQQQIYLLGNTTTGVTGFFTSINPVYAILAVLVIILVLVVLVRVVSGGTGGRESAPQL